MEEADQAEVSLPIFAIAGDHQATVLKTGKIVDLSYGLEAARETVIQIDGEEAVRAEVQTLQQEMHERKSEIEVLKRARAGPGHFGAPSSAGSQAGWWRTGAVS